MLCIIILFLVVLYVIIDFVSNKKKLKLIVYMICFIGLRDIFEVIFLLFEVDILDICFFFFKRIR